MALNKELLRKKLISVQNKNEKKSNLWKPQPGESVIRILPYKYNKENPFIELYFHYDLNGKTFLSPITFGRPDPIVEFARELQQTGNKEDWKQGKKLEPKRRTYVPIITRGEEDKGVRYWGFGIQIYEELLKLIQDPEYGDITDVVNGTDLIIERKTPKEAQNNYGSTTIRPKRARSKLSDNKDFIKKLLTEQKKITDIYQEASYEVLKAELEKYLNPEEEVETPPSASTVDPAEKDNEVDDILDKLNDVFEED